jgi:prolyl oligopeptidase
MIRLAPPLLILWAAAAPLSAQVRPAPSRTTAARVPAAPRVDSTDTYFGTAVPDPYRWLEHYERPEVRRWYAAEDSAARAVIDANVAFPRILARLAAARRSRPYDITQLVEETGRVFYLKRVREDQGPSLYVREGDGGERRLFAPAQVTAAGAVLTGYEVAPGGSYVTVYYAAGGNEREFPLIVEVASGRVVPGEIADRAEWIVWQEDAHAFLYMTGRDPAPGVAYGARHAGLPLLRHVMGTPPAGDRVVFDPGQATGSAGGHVGGVEVQNGVAIAVVIQEGHYETPETFIVPAEALEGGGAVTWRRISSPADSVSDIFVRGPWLHAVSHRVAPGGRLVRILLSPEVLAGRGSVDWAGAQVLLQDSTIDFVDGQNRPVFARDGVYWIYGAHGRSRLFRFPYGSLAKEELPSPGEGVSFGLIEGDRRRVGALFVMGGWTRADRRYRYDPSTRRIEELPGFVNPPDPFDHLDGLTATTVLVPARDGAMVPLTILRRAGPRTPRPTILYGYGAYGFTEDPAFRSRNRPWTEAGGTFAICHTRGGGYFGSAWHLAGMQATKPNTWNDAIACAEYLIREGFTRPAMLGISGGSAGGILAGRALTERPDLFGAAAIEVGVADMVRVSRSSEAVHEFGSAATEAGFRSLLAMSTYHHVRPGTTYPATLLYAGFNDARVSPWHPAKVAAALRYAGGDAALPGGARPVLLRVDFDAGHGLVGGSVALSELRQATVLAFFASRLGLPIQ